MAAQELASQVGVAPACRALGVSRSTLYRRQRPAPGHQQPRPMPGPGTVCDRARGASSTCSPRRASSTTHRAR